MQLREAASLWRLAIPAAVVRCRCLLLVIDGGTNPGAAVSLRPMEVGCKRVTGRGSHPTR